MTYDMDWIIKDMTISIQNKTKMTEEDIEYAIKYLSKKYNLSKKDAFRKLLNLAIDKKLALVYVETRGLKNLFGVRGILQNLYDL